MFLDFVDYDGVTTNIQVRHIMAVWASPEQLAMRPYPQVNFLMQTGSASEIWLIRGELDDIMDRLKDCW